MRLEPKKLKSFQNVLCQNSECTVTFSGGLLAEFRAHLFYTICEHFSILNQNSEHVDKKNNYYVSAAMVACISLLKIFTFLYFVI